MARAPAAAVSGLNCSESAVAGPAAAAASRETRGAGPGQTKLQARRADCSHCRRGINARPRHRRPVSTTGPCKPRCMQHWPALQQCTAVHSPLTGLPTTKIHSADNPSNWIRLSTPSSSSGLWVQPTFHHERLSSGLSALATRDGENYSAHAMTMT